MNSRSPRVAVLMLVALSVTLLGQQSDDPQGDSNNPQTRVNKPQNVNDKTSPSKILEFPIEGNSIDADKFYESVLSQMTWTTKLTQKVAGELKQARPVSALEFDLEKGRISLEALQILITSCPTAFEVVEGDPNKSGTAVFRVNMGELESKWSDQKLGLRNWLSKRSQRPLFEINGKVGFDGHVEKNHLIVVIPGLHGGDSTACEMAAAIHQRTGLASCAFRYPNDAPVDESTDYLVQVLKKLHLEYPKRTLTLVTHSMGGLVARNAIEQRLKDNPRCLGIERIVLICPPNQGSIFAEYAGVLEGAEQLQRLLKRGSGRKFLAGILDGFNEAPNDLIPGSEFLQKLQAAKRHPQVKYAVLAGDAGLIDPLIALVGNELLELLKREAKNPKPIQDRAHNLLNSDELRKGLGDGVVTLVSAKLEGVTDFEVLPINHLEWGELDKPSGQRVLDEIVERITRRSF
jgi:pimeloyl-ACP methyl ester carboxylesterase